MKIGLYPGTFDPLTNGHLDIITRSSSLCDKLIIAVAKNTSKNPFFSISKRIDLINEALISNKIDNKLVYAQSFDNLLIDFAKIKQLLLRLSDHKGVNNDHLSNNQVMQADP